MTLWDHISQQITEASGEAFKIDQQQAVGGGCINEARRISDGHRNYFVKVNHISHGDMFQAEAEGLQAMVDSQTIKVPAPICYGTFENQCFIVMEHLAMHGSINTEQFGQQFAAMHQITQPQFGWHRNNTIGSTPQINTQCDDWIEFWRKHRLAYQLELAINNGCGKQLSTPGEKLLEHFPALFKSYQPKASMLHGDLWSGNASALSDGTPVIYDPAFYYGDREADLAMTQLFGSFGARFYQAYDEVWPLDEGYKVRKTFYNLYHIINHFNMFGGGYLGQAIAMMKQVLSEI